MLIEGKNKIRVLKMAKQNPPAEQIPVDDSFEKFQESELLSPHQERFEDPGPRPHSPVTNIISQHYAPEGQFDQQHISDSEIGNLIKKAELGNKKLNLFFHGT